MTGAANWGRIPAELRTLNQWVVAGADKMPLTSVPTSPVPRADGLYNASSTAPDHWLPFEIAAQHAHQRGLGIGYVLSKDDPYTCIDFDVKDASNETDKNKWTHPDAFHWFWDIAQRWDSYAEISRSGKGLHVWVRANIGAGRKRSPIEVYSQERYIICTGNVVIDRPILDRQEWLTDFVRRYLSDTNNALKVQLVEVEPVMEDNAIMNMAWHAENSHNFRELWQGRWPNYKSQSEADLALISMLTFYSKSNSQVRRLFRMSVLGQREKAVKNDKYINRTLILIRSREARDNKIDSSGIARAAEEVMRLKRAADSPPLHVPELAIGTPQPAPVQVAAALAAPLSRASAEAGAEGLPWPPGFMGVLAQFIYDSAPRQVKEVAIVGALGLIAGIAGKAWFIPGSGLNVYAILVAQSAIGKEAMHSGVSALVTAASARAPTIQQFVNFSDFASGPALIKACAAVSSFVNVCGEWGHKLKRIANDDGRDTAMATLRMTMTNLYQKSGPQSIVGGITYSNKDSNIASVSGVAYSMIGETTPKTFYTSLTESMMEDGFLSRFIIVEYNGVRPPLNTDQRREPPAVVSDYLGQMANTAQQRLSATGVAPVNCSAESAQLIYAFEKECDEQINSTRDESWRQMWNRASLKVMRVSGLMAVGDNYIHPCIEKHHVEWALGLVRRDIAIMQRKLADGDVGTDDSSRENKALSVIKAYFVNGVPPGYGVPTAMRDNGIFPQMFLQKKCQKVPAFVAHRGGSTEALKQVLRSLCDSGYIMEVDKTKMVENYNFHGKCYRVIKLPDFDAERFSS